MNPFDMFTEWYRSIRSTSPDKVILSTCDVAGMPNSRIVLIKKYDETGITFFTNLCSKKAQEIQKNNRVSMLIPSSLRTIIINGKAELISTEESDEYFSTRNRKKQISAWSSKQSEILSSEEVLLTRFKLYCKKFAYTTVPRPNFWGGFKVKPDKFEFIDSKNTKYFIKSLNNEWSSS